MLNKEKPKISVVIPTHNRPDRVKNAIQSVLNQTFQDFEIIVIDDGLEKRAENVVKLFNDPRIKYIKHETNRGGSAARNTGINNAQADWIAFLDDDDEWLPEKLEEQYGQIKKYGEKAGYFFCAVKFFGEKDKTVKIRKYKNIKMGNFYKEFLSYSIKAYTPTLIVKKIILESSGMFDESLPSNQETELMVRVSKKTIGFYSDRVLVKVNFLEGEHIGGDIKKRIAGRKMFLKKHINDLLRYPDIYSKHFKNMGDLHRIDLDFPNAKKCYIKSFKKKLDINTLLLILLMYFPKIYKILKQKNVKNYIKQN